MVLDRVLADIRNRFTRELGELPSEVALAYEEGKMITIRMHKDIKNAQIVVQDHVEQTELRRLIRPVLGSRPHRNAL